MLCSALTHKRNNNHFLLRLSISFYFLSFHIYPIDILLSIYTTSKFAPCYHLSNPNVATLVQSFTFCFVYFCYQCPFCVSLTLCISCLSLSCQSTYCFLSTRPQNSFNLTRSALFISSTNVLWSFLAATKTGWSVPNVPRKPRKATGKEASRGV